MLKKSYSKTGSSCRVTFKLPAEALPEAVQEAAVLGEWNSWNETANRMARRKDGTFSATISLEAGHEYRFRYLLDGASWLNDDAPDGVVPNRFGSRDCVVAV